MANFNLTQTGEEIQVILDRVASGYIYMGTADLTTTPDTTNPNVYYILTAVGTYTNFGNITHSSGITIAMWNGTAWSYQNVPSSAVVPTDATITENSVNPVQSGGVYPLAEIINGASPNYTADEYLKNNNTTAANAGWGYTDYVPYTQGNTVLWSADNASHSYYILFYDAQKNFISGSDFSYQYNASNGGRLITTTQINSYARNAAYLRASFTLNYADAKIKVGDNVVWTKQEQQESLPSKVTSIQSAIFSDEITENIKLVGVAYQGKYIYKSTHEIVDTTTNGSFIIPVSVGDTIFVRANVKALANYAVLGFTDDLTNGYTSGVSVLIGVSSDTDPYPYTYTFTAPKNGYLIAWSTSSVYGSSYYVEMFKLENRQKEIYDYYLPSSFQLQTFGDSITDNYWGDMSSWVSYIQDNIHIDNLTIINSAVGGAAIGGTGSYNIPNQIINGYTRDGGTIAQPLSADTQLVVIFAGTNDWAGGTALSSTTANLAQSFQYIYEHSKAKILFCTPLQRWNTTDQSLPTDENGVPINSQNITLRQECDALIEVCKRFSVPVLDLNADANINRYNISDYSLDGLHPQRYGDMYISKLICAKIKSILR